MATQKVLVEVVAHNMGVPLESVKVIDRLLAVAGLRTRALRGRGHTPMTYQDAANLIIATSLDASPRNAVDLVNAYRSLPASRIKESSRIAHDALGATFGEALAQVIEAVAASREQFSAPEDAREHMSMTVILHGPRPRAQIELTRSSGVSTFEFGELFATQGDLRRTVQFSQVTLGFVGEAIAEQ